MVALADWYILPILLQLEKLSGPTIWGFITVGWIFGQWVQLTSIGLSIGSRSAGRWYHFNLLEWCFVYDHTTGQSKMDLNSRANHKTPRGWTKKDLYCDLYYSIQGSSYFVESMELFANRRVTLLLCLVHVVPPVWWAVLSPHRDPIVTLPRGGHSDEGIIWGLRLYYLVLCLRNMLFSKESVFHMGSISFHFTSIDILFPLLKLGIRSQNHEPRRKGRWHESTGVY